MFSGCTMSLDNKEAKLGCSNQETSLSAGINTGVGLVPFHAWKCVLAADFSCMNLPEVPGCHLLQQMSSQ